MTREAIDRRAALGRGLGAAGALGAAALLGPRAAFAQDEPPSGEDDPSVLEGLIGAEQTAVVAYEQKGDLFGPDRPVAELLRRQDRAHAAALTAELEKLGGSPPPPPIPSGIPGFTEVTNTEQMLAFAIRLENQSLAAYVDAATKFDAGELLTLGAKIAGNVGEHLVILRQIVGVEPVPGAFPSGSEKT